MDGFCWWEQSSRKGAAIKMQNYLTFFCLAQCPKVIYGERVTSHMALSAVALPSRRSLSGKHHDGGPLLTSNGKIVEKQFCWKGLALQWLRKLRLPVVECWNGGEQTLSVCGLFSSRPHPTTCRTHSPQSSCYLLGLCWCPVFSPGKA